MERSLQETRKTIKFLACWRRQILCEACGQITYFEMRNFMKPFLSVFITLCTVVCGAQPEVQVDVCVYGGTSAGVIAAYTAKMYGKKVILIEQGRHLGGLSAGGLGYTDIGNKFAVTGLARDFYRKVGAHYGKFEQWIFEPHVAEEIFQQYISSANVDVLFEHRILQAKNEKGNIRSITLENTRSKSELTISAKVFIDCSYEGDLMAKAGVTYTVGREANQKFGETYNGVQLRDKHQFPDGIDPYKTKGNPSSGLLWGISDAKLDPPGSGDRKVQAYNFRICLTDQPANMIPITKPDGYDSTRYELLVRLMEKEPTRPYNLILKPDLMPGRKTDINNNGPFSTDMIGMNYEYPEASYSERARIQKEHELYIKGLLYFIGNSSRLPKHLGAEMQKWGYPRDEYQDNGNWSHQMYVREARRMVGEYVMTQANCTGTAKVEDGVGMAAYTMDSHNVQRVVVNGMVKNEGDVQIGGFPPYPIAYRSLVPKASECGNLLVPVCLSASHIAYGSIRMEPVFMVLAQSSAVAAVMAIDKRVPVQLVSVKLLQQKIKSDPLANGTAPEILVDNDDKGLVVLTGDWTAFQGQGGYAQGYVADTLFNAKASTARFSPAIPKAGDYNIYVYCPIKAGGTTKLSLTVFDSKTKKTVVISPPQKVQGQTSGEWVSAGRHKLAAGKSNHVMITTAGADGIVIADAILFVPAR
jgi:hypothetical protein